MLSQDLPLSSIHSTEGVPDAPSTAGSSAVFAWGLPSAGAAPPGSHTLFAAHAAAALDVRIAATIWVPYK